MRAPNKHLRDRLRSVIRRVRQDDIERFWLKFFQADRSHCPKIAEPRSTSVDFREGDGPDVAVHKDNLAFRARFASGRQANGAGPATQVEDPITWIYFGRHQQRPAALVHLAISEDPWPREKAQRFAFVHLGLHHDLMPATLALLVADAPDDRAVVGMDRGRLAEDPLHHAGE